MIFPTNKLIILTYDEKLFESKSYKQIRIARSNLTNMNICI
jgi:hypothetical protein